jgi:hypothetical protein
MQFSFVFVGAKSDPWLNLFLSYPYTSETILDQAAVRDQRAKNFAPETFMDTRFVKQLEDSGFIKGLYPKG